jgi:uncharacterized protein (TIGR00290 family)
MAIRLSVCWSGGKDAALALHAAARCELYEVAELFCSLSEDTRRTPMHGIPEALIDAQAAALGLAVRKVPIPNPCPNEVYEQRMGAAAEECKRLGIGHMAFGDLFLEDIREYRERNLARAGLRAVLPLWGLDTRALAERFIELGYRALVASVDTQGLAASFAGRDYDAGFLADLPDGVDPCGENGEFHTFVHDGPLFSAPVAFTLGEVRTGERFAHVALG